MDKKIIEYNIPIQDKKHIEDYYKMCKKILGNDFEPKEKFLTTDEHVDILINKLYEALEEIGEDNSWYVGDGIKVKIELEYEPENK